MKQIKLLILLITCAVQLQIGNAQNYQLNDGSNDYNKKWNYIGYKNDKGITGGCNVGRTSLIYIDKEGDPTLNTVYLGTENSGLWRTTNFEDDKPIWECITEDSRFVGLGVTSIDIWYDPNSEASKIIIGTAVGDRFGWSYGAGILISTDGGEEWNTLGLAATVVQEVKFAPDNHEEIIAFSRNKIYKSDNGGFSFTEVCEKPKLAGKTPNFHDLAFKPNNPDIIYATTEDFLKGDVNGDNNGARVYYSDDGGDNWSDETCIFIGDCNGPSEYTRIDVAVTTTDPDLLILLANKTSGQSSPDFYQVSNDGSVTNINAIIPAHNGYSSWRMADFVISPLDNDKLFVGSQKKMLYDLGALNQDGSVSRTNSSTYGLHMDARDFEIYIDNNGEEVLLEANDGGVAIRKKYKGTQTWINKNGHGLEIAQVWGFGISVKQDMLGGGLQDQHQWIRRDKEWSDNGGGDGYKGAVRYNDGSAFIGNNMRIVRYYYDPNQQSEYTFGISRETTGIDVQQTSGNVYFAGYGNYTNETTPFTDLAGGCFLFSSNIDGPYDSGNYKKMYKPTSFDDLPAVSHLRVFQGVANGDHILYISGTKSLDGNPRFWRVTIPEGATTSTVANTTWTDLSPSLYTKLSGESVAVKSIEVDHTNGNEVWVGFNGNLESSEPMVAYCPDVMAATPVWEYLNLGLKNFPVNSLEQDHNSGYLYAGTDIGVFVNTNPTLDPSLGSSKWELFNSGMPVVRVTDLEIDECSKQLYASTYGRGFWVTDLPRDPNDVTVEIIANTPYNTNQEIDYDILVKAGNTLTITAEIKMHRERKIMVEPGATLIVDGGKITSTECGRWQGIEAWGNPNLAQNTLNQSNIILKNNAVLENADIAISTSKKDDDEKIDFSKSGGAIIDARDAYFLDNHISVEFVKYREFTTAGPSTTYRNKSYFDNCTFEITKPLLDLVDNTIKKSSPSMVSAWGVDWVWFKNCTFKNSVPDEFDRIEPLNTQSKIFNPRGTGISTLNANLVITGNSFEGLSYGVKDKNIGAFAATSKITSNTFTNCEHGISIDGGDGDVVESNTVSWNDNYTPDPKFQRPVGCELKNSKNIKYAYNKTEQDHQSLILIANTHGLICSNSKGSINIYKNDFKNLQVGIWTNGNNKHFQAQCNVFSNPDFPALHNWKNGVIDVVNDVSPHLGSCNAGIVPGNEFKDNCAGLEHIMIAAGSAIPRNNMRYFYSTSNLKHPSQTCSSPVDLVLRGCNASPSCPSPHPGYGNPNWFYSEVANMEFILPAKEGLITTGSDPALLSKALDNSYSVSSLMNDLIVARPYLSDAILIALIERTNQLVQADMKIILLEHSGLSESVQAAFDNSSWPQTLKDEVAIYQNQLSTRTELEIEIDAYNLNLMTAIGGLMVTYKEDPLYESSSYWTAVHSFINGNQQYFSPSQNVALAIMENDLINARLHLNNWSPLGTDEIDMYSFFDIRLSLLENAKNWFEMDNSQLSQIIDLSVKDSEAGSYANTVLEILGVQTSFIEHPEFQQSAGSQPNSATLLGENASFEQKSSEISIHPNPANDRFILASTDEIQTIVVFGVDGKIVRESSANGQKLVVVDISDWTKGMYVVKVRTKSGLYTERMVKK